YVARIDAVTISDNRSVSKVSNQNGVYFSQSSDPGDIVEDYSYVLGGESKGMVGYTLYDADSAYRVSQEDFSELSLIMDYENCRLTGSSKAGESMTFDKKGYVSVTGSSADFTLGMVADKDYPTDWFAIEVSGTNVNNASLEMCEKGWVLTADNLEEITVSVNNKDVSANTSFNAESNSVLIYEIDENTIGILADNDNDGVYETPVETHKNELPGDVNGNGKIDAADYAMCKRAYLKTFTLSEEQKERADINKNGKVDTAEYAMIKRHFLKTYTIPGAEGK
ncbi:MAG: dockerin type I repeat-containing protein, partial [Clostridia bacterium]|nr:dockerin type I repeat-containing protein [Clostridia bacterium]